MKRIQSNLKNNATQVVVVKNPIGKIYQLSVSIFMILLMSLFLLSCSNKKKEVVESASQGNIEASIKTNKTMASAKNYKIVPNEKVCMVNYRFMGIDQIPNDINGITYYGCCENFAEKLQKNLEDVCFGNNLLNDRKVDKALAVIVQDKRSGSGFDFPPKEDTNTLIA